MMLKFFKREEFWVSLLMVIVLGFSYLPLLLHARSCPPGKVFGFSTGFPDDFLGNLIIVQEGYRGDFLRTSEISSTIPSKPTFSKMEYIFIGRLAKILTIRPEIFFHVVRFGLSLLLIFTIYRLLTIIFSKSCQRLVSLLLIFFSTQIDLNFLPFVNHKSLIDYWSPLQFNQRLAYYPHYLLSFIFGLWTIIFLAKAIDRKNGRQFFWASLLGFLTALVHPPVAIFLLFCLAFCLIASTPGRNLFGLAIGLFFFASSLPLLYFKIISKNFPYNILVGIESNFGLPINFFELILGLGPVFFLALLSLTKITQKNKILPILFFGAPLVIILGFFAGPKVFGLANVRFLQTPFFVFLGISAIFGLKGLSKKAYIITILIVFLLSVNSLFYSIKHSLNAFKNSSFFCLNQKTIEAVNWLEANTEPAKIVLAGFETGTLIAAYAGNRVYTTIYTSALPSFANYQQALNQFYHQKLTGAEAKTFLDQQNISYIFFGAEEKELAGQSRLNYLFLKLVYKNEEVKIYKRLN